MSKKKKRRKSFIPESEAKDAVKKSLYELNWKLLGKVALYFVIVFAVYKVGIKIADLYNSKANSRCRSNNLRGGDNGTVCGVYHNKQRYVQRYSDERTASGRYDGQRKGKVYFRPY